jgi:AraC family transcriptional regulator of adaptative response/methylated-DNA-[protein]-cysteine methyltransferase
MTPHPTIARAIRFLAEHWHEQPSLASTAAVVGLGPHHFERTFKAACGITPKRFLQHLTLAHAKAALRARGSVLDAALGAGLSGPSRLHDLFVAAEAVTPGSYKARGAGLHLVWGVHEAPFGPMVLALSDRGLAWLGFVDDGDDPLARPLEDYPRANWRRDDAATAEAARHAFAWAGGEAVPLRLHLRGTAFQLKVWQALLALEPGETLGYGDLGARVGAERAGRAVGSAVGANRIALLIPCHRVLRASGAIDGYRWGMPRKAALLALEGAGKSPPPCRG